MVEYICTLVVSLLEECSYNVGYSMKLLFLFIGRTVSLNEESEGTSLDSIGVIYNCTFKKNSASEGGAAVSVSSQLLLHSVNGKQMTRPYSVCHIPYCYYIIIRGK